VAKIIDVDFKRKKVNFTYDLAVRMQQIEQIRADLLNIYWRIQSIEKNRAWMNRIERIFSDIIFELKRREK
jgi:hypothetical protein